MDSLLKYSAWSVMQTKAQPWERKISRSSRKVNSPSEYVLWTCIAPFSMEISNSYRVRLPTFPAYKANRRVPATDRATGKDHGTFRGPASAHQLASASF